MPLYKKSTTKSKVRTNSSFISPLVTQNKLKNLLLDDYKENLPIPTKNKILEHLINTPQDGESLFEKLQKKSFRDFKKSPPEVEKRNSTSRDEKSRKLEEPEISNTDLHRKRSHAVLENIERNTSSDKISNKVIVSPTLFDSHSNCASSIQNGSNNLRTKSSMTVTTRIEINTEEDQTDATEESETPSSQISDLLKECVMNNLKMAEKMRMSGKLRKPSENFLKRLEESLIEEDDADVNSYLESLLNNVAASKEVLSQKKVNDKPGKSETEVEKKSSQNISADADYNKKRRNLKRKSPMKWENEFCGKDTVKKMKNKNKVSKAGKKKELNDMVEDKDNNPREKKQKQKKEKTISCKNAMDESQILNVKKSRDKSSIPISHGSSHNSSSIQNNKNRISDTPKLNSKVFASQNPEEKERNLKKLLELQHERDVGLYVYCDSCNKVRYLPDCKDPLELPDKWFCYMNTDSNYNKCSDPDYEIPPEKEELIIHNKFNAGSIVWAKMDGYPWWPAIVDDDPDLTDYFWLDGENSTEPSWYHVTFFDTAEVTRAWIRTAFLVPFEKKATNSFLKPKKNNLYKHRVDFAAKQAKEACKMTLLERLRQYSFVSRYLNKMNRKDARKKKGKKEGTIKDNGKKMKKTTSTNKEKSFINELYDNLSVSSTELSDILKFKQAGINNRIISDDDLENIDLGNFI